MERKVQMNSLIGITLPGMFANCEYLSEQEFMEMYNNNKKDLEYLGAGLDDGLFMDVVANTKTGNCYTSSFSFEYLFPDN